MRAAYYASRRRLPSKQKNFLQNRKIPTIFYSNQIYLMHQHFGPVYDILLLCLLRNRKCTNKNEVN